MQEEEKNNEGKVSTEYVAPKQDVQSISVEVTPEMYLLDGVSVLVLITASVLVSGIVILKRNPKDILSEMSQEDDENVRSKECKLCLQNKKR